MKEFPQDERLVCEWMIDELEELPSGEDAGETAEVLLARLPEAAREHAAKCAECENAVRDFVDTRLALAEMKERLPGAGPWFTTRVMQAITAQEEEIEERQNGFWTSVRRLAPRIVAFATLLLMVGGTWAFQERRAARANGPQMGPAEGIFEAAPTAPVNDDIIASATEEK
ncbi:MAG: hypothetical protein WAK48_14230 [Candidatus Acidiferrum sp.]|jgi:hypothetical protein